MGKALKGSFAHILKEESSRQKKNISLQSGIETGKVQ